MKNAHYTTHNESEKNIKKFSKISIKSSIFCAKQKNPKKEKNVRKLLGNFSEIYKKIFQNNPLCPLGIALIFIIKLYNFLTFLKKLKSTKKRIFQDFIFSRFLTARSGRHGHARIFIFADVHFTRPI